VILGALRVLRALWAGPNSLLGLLLGAAVLACGGRLQRVHGTLEFTYRQRPGDGGPLMQRLPYRAITLGHVIVAASQVEMNRHRGHERVHVRQYERWGPAFLPAYGLCGAWQWLRGRRAYLDNPFEVEARSIAAQRGAMARDTTSHD
jgi:hypothetical protein